VRDGVSDRLIKTGKLNGMINSRQSLFNAGLFIESFEQQQTGDRPKGRGKQYISGAETKQVLDFV
jgi:hypothetical protein